MSRHTSKFNTSQEKHINKSSPEKNMKISTNKEYCWQIMCTNSLVLMFFIAVVLGMTLSIVGFHIFVLIVQLGVSVQQRTLFMHNLHRPSHLFMAFIQK